MTYPIALQSIHTDARRKTISIDYRICETSVAHFNWWQLAQNVQFLLIRQALRIDFIDIFPVSQQECILRIGIVRSKSGFPRISSEWPAILVDRKNDFSSENKTPALFSSVKNKIAHIFGWKLKFSNFRNFVGNYVLNLYTNRDVFHISTVFSVHIGWPCKIFGMCFHF